MSPTTHSYNIEPDSAKKGAGLLGLIFKDVGVCKYFTVPK